MLPFIDKAPVISVKPYSGEKIFNPFNIQPHNYNLPVLPVYHVKPLEINVIAGSNEEIANTLFKGPSTVITVDYEIVADILEIQDGVALYPTPNGYISSNIEFPSLITLASNGSRFTMTESLVEDISKLRALKKSQVVIQQTQSPIYQRLEDYLKSGYVTQRTLLLIGQSGVSKSALVKSIANKLGFRVQDMRLAYSSRLDIQGLTEITYKDGLPLSSESPSDELIKCTDEYINYCRSALPLIKERALALKKQGAPEEQMQQLRDLYKQYQYYAKPPILFLDEVNRTEASVRQAFTNILTDKAFMGHEMKIARVVAAANAPIGASDELADIFLTNNSDDAAFNDRWEAVPVTPEDNLESWKNWAEGTNSDGLRNICKEVVDFLEKNPREYYNMDDVVAVYQDTYDETQTATTPYPSYRTWEFVSNYLQTKQEKIYLKKTITGLIGDRVGTMFCQYLDSLGWSPKQDDEENTFPNFIEEGISSGTPVMLLTPSGTAKTSTINQVVKKLGYKKITINLAECDRTDLIGAPAKVETSVMVAGEVEGIDKQLAKSLKDAVGNFNLPATVTMKAPKASLVYEFEQAVREKQQILLVFEEANRVNNPAVMGALLQVISDHILFGVKFNPRYVKVICTANIGDNYGDTRGMDAAIAARFSIYKQNEYTLSDARRIRKYMKENFSPYIGAYLDTLSDDALLALVSQVESRALEKSVPSTRAWSDLSMYLEDKETNSVVRGKVMFKGTEEAMVLRKANREKQYGPSLKQAVDIIEENLDNWLALDSQLKVHMNVDGDSEAFSVNDLKELFIECKSGLELGDNDLVEPMQSIVQAIAKVDQEAKSMRQKAISFILGDSAQEFCDFYNKVSGSKVVSLDIPDLKDKALIGDYWAQITEGIVSPVDLLGIGLSTVRSINNYFGDNLPVDSYKYYIQYILETYRTADQRLRFLYDLVDDKEIDALISRISDNDEPWIIKITGLAGMQVSKDSLDKLKATTTASKPRFV